MKRFCAFILFILCNSSISPSGAVHASSTDTLAPDTLSKWVTNGPPFDFILIDVRDSSTELSVTGVIADAECHPYNFSYNRGVFDLLYPQLPKQAQIVLYCKSGGRSGICAAKLDSAGFTHVHSMKGGFNNWTGPVNSISYVKPATDLPAFSMLHSVTKEIALRQKAVPDRFILSARENRLYAAATVTAHHSLGLYNSAGACVFRADDPFSKNTCLVLPASVYAGFYWARLSVPRQSERSFKIIVSR